jgi:hypothetical protein
MSYMDFRKAFPAPWQIQGDQIVDGRGETVNTFESDDAGEVEFWNGIIEAINARAVKGPVTQSWAHAIPFMQQTVLLTAVRGPDGIAKYHPCKYLLRWFRRCTLVSSLDHSNLMTPFEAGGGSFMGPSLDRAVPQDDWHPDMDLLVGEYLRALDELPHHFQLHFMHAAEIVGYKHPDPEIRAWWLKTYLRLVHDMHLWPETEEQMDLRLGDDRSNWLARNDVATVA